ncbi:MAG: secretin and TonB N-terminal domain-containing protein [Candidatus Omnitrophota bacterium]
MTSMLRFIIIACCVVSGPGFVSTAFAQTALSQDKSQAAPVPLSPAVEIKQLESLEPVYSIELSNVDLIDLFGVIVRDHNLNMGADSGVSGTVTASLQNVTLEEALEMIAEMSDLVARKKGGILRIGLNSGNKTVTLKNAEAGKLLEERRDNPGGAVAPGTFKASSLSNIYDIFLNKGKIQFLIFNSPSAVNANQAAGMVNASRLEWAREKDDVIIDNKLEELDRLVSQRKALEEDLSEIEQYIKQLQLKLGDLAQLRRDMEGKSL